MIQLKEITREIFTYSADEYEIGTWNDEILEWVEDNVEEYQLYALTGRKYAPNKVAAMIIVYESIN